MKPFDWKPIVFCGAAGAVGGVVLWALLRPTERSKLSPPAKAGLQRNVKLPNDPCGEDRYSVSGLAALAGASSCSTNMDLLGFPSNVDERHDYILKKVRNKEYQAVFAPLVSRANGHEALFWVFGDALKVDGVRVIVTAALEQKIADSLGMSLLTPKLADLIFQQADMTLQPITRPPNKYLPDKTPVWNPPMDSTEAMILESRNIDKAIEAAGGLDGRDQYIVSTVGKHWVIDNDLLKAPGRAENYGFHYWGSKKRIPETDDFPVTAIKNASTGEGALMMQPRMKGHNINHSDYSQNVVLVDNRVIVDGNSMSLSEVLTNPELAPLASHQGVLKVLRQPGVQRIDPIV